MSSNPLPELVSAYIDGEATPSERVLVEQALVEDAELRRLFYQFKGLRARLERMPRLRARIDFSRMILQRIERLLNRRQQATRTVTAPSRTGAWKAWCAWAGAVAAAVLAVIAIDRLSPQSVPVAQNPPNAPAQPDRLAKQASPQTETKGLALDDGKDAKKYFDGFAKSATDPDEVDRSKDLQRQKIPPTRGDQFNTPVAKNSPLGGQGGGGGLGGGDGREFAEHAIKAASNQVKELDQLAHFTDTLKVRFDVQPGANFPDVLNEALARQQIVWVEHDTAQESLGRRNLARRMATSDKAALDKHGDVPKLKANDFADQTEEETKPAIQTAEPGVIADSPTKLAIGELQRGTGVQLVYVETSPAQAAELLNDLRKHPEIFVESSSVSDSERALRVVASDRTAGVQKAEGGRAESAAALPVEQRFKSDSAKTQGIEKQETRSQTDLPAGGGMGIAKGSGGFARRIPTQSEGKTPEAIQGVVNGQLQPTTESKPAQNAEAGGAPAADPAAITTNHAKNETQPLAADAAVPAPKSAAPGEKRIRTGDDVKQLKDRYGNAAPAAPAPAIAPGPPNKAAAYGASGKDSPDTGRIAPDAPLPGPSTVTKSLAPVDPDSAPRDKKASKGAEVEGEKIGPTVKLLIVFRALPAPVAASPAVPPAVIPANPGKN